MVFCASLADVFEDKLDQPEMNDWRHDLSQLVNDTPYLDWLFLTKRIENVRYLWPDQLQETVWIGTSVENQDQYDKRVEHLLNIPAAVHFISAEPLLGPIDMDLSGRWYGRDSLNEMVNWVIVGGESGPNARPMHPDWVRSIRDQCQEAGIPLLLKQWGEWAPDCLCRITTPHKTVIRPEPGKPGVMFHCGKKNAGRLLDGREWNELPGKVGDDY